MMKLLPGQQSTPPHKVEGWKGYTLAELRYRQAYVAARLELEKEQLARDIKAEKSALTPMGIVGNLGSIFRYLNWGILAFQAFKSIKSLKSIGSIFKRRKS